MLLQVSVLTSCDVTSLMTDEATGRVTGVRYRLGGEGEHIEMPASAVVLTTGGERGVILRG